MADKPKLQTQPQTHSPQPGEASLSRLRRAEQAQPARAMRGATLSLKPAPGPRPTQERWQDATAVVSVRGELDRDALWAIDFTLGRASVEAGKLVLDLLEVTHLDYAGVCELVARRRELTARGGDLGIAVKNPYVTNILKAAGGADLALFRSVEEASGAQVAVAGARRAVASRKKGP
jgi:anti-anti-sigma factor